MDKGNEEEEDIVIDTRQGPDSRFPPGYRFNPRDDELILHYLRRKIANEPLLYDVFNDVNLYEYHPATLVEKFKHCGDNRWYFFTPRDRKYPNGIRPNRKTVDGYWKATGVEKKIIHDGEQIGVRKALVFYTGKAGKGSKTDWIMYEYINQDRSNRPRRPDGTMKLDDWVLCTIQKKRGADEDTGGEPEEPTQAQQASTSQSREQKQPRADEENSGEPEGPPKAQQATTSRSTEKPGTSQVQQIPHDGREVEPLDYQVIHNNNGSHVNYYDMDGHANYNTGSVTQAPSMSLPNDFTGFISSDDIGDHHPSAQNFQQDILNPSMRSIDLGYQLGQTPEFGFENQQMISESLYPSPPEDPLDQVQTSEFGFENQQMISESLYPSPPEDPLDRVQTSEFGFENQQMISESLYSSPPEDPLEVQLRSIFGPDPSVFGEQTSVDDRDDIAEVFPPQQNTVFQAPQDNQSNDNFISNPDSSRK
ncbi:uncharacterized protein [Elaeis guineensis]|uniref:uncharacterized protein n=1 Tax=Elaeis guineensis var. tenera TaxID=51953 RepID=UPI003C6D8147